MNGDTNTHHSSDTKIDWPAAIAANGRWLRMVVYARLGDGHAVDEVLQDVAAYVVKQSPTLKDSSKLQAWLYRVAVRQSLQYRRRHGRERRKTNEFAQQIRGDAESQNGKYDPLRWILAAEERELVRQALGRLRHGDRELLLLKYTENWTCRELGERFGVQVTTVETRLLRARQRLRRELARVDITEESP